MRNDIAHSPNLLMNVPKFAAANPPRHYRHHLYCSAVYSVTTGSVKVLASPMPLMIRILPAVLLLE